MRQLFNLSNFLIFHCMFLILSISLRDIIAIVKRFVCIGKDNTAILKRFMCIGKDYIAIVKKSMYIPNKNYLHYQRKKHLLVSERLHQELFPSASISFPKTNAFLLLLKFYCGAISNNFCSTTHNSTGSIANIHYSICA